ncbi:hypothetical protein A4A49_64903, partial [Nicotiana attenuata]
MRHKPAPIEMPRFHGDNPESWVFAAERYFDFYHIVEDHKLSLASFYLDVRNLLPPEGRLSKFRQTSTVAEFQARFKSIANKTIDVPDSWLRGGPPKSALVRSHPLLPTPNLNSSASHTPNRLPFKRLTTAEIQQRREKGLCYHCDEKYSVGHKCKASPQLLLLENDDTECPLPDSLSDELLAEDLQNLEVLQHSAISYHALAGGYTASTIRFTGQVNGSSVQVLVDGGSDHNFIQTRVATFLHLDVEPISSFLVVVGSGQRLRCAGLVRNVPLEIQGTLLTLDFFVLPMHGADLLLDVSWLATLGPVVTDYVQRLLEFGLGGQYIRWKGNPPLDLQPVQLQSLRRLCATDVVSSFYHLELVDSTPACPPAPPPALSVLLDSFKDVFTKP